MIKFYDFIVNKSCNVGMNNVEKLCVVSITFFNFLLFFFIRSFLELTTLFYITLI